MDPSGTRAGEAHQYARMPFNTLEIDARNTHLDPFMLCIAALFIFLWWRTSLGSWSFLARNARENAANGTEMGRYGSRGYAAMAD